MTEVLTTDDLRDAWPALDLEERVEGLGLLDVEDGAELFAGLAAAQQAELVLMVPAARRRAWLRGLEPDDIADLIQALPAAARAPTIAMLEPRTRHEVTALLAYAEDVAGGLMNPRYARLRREMTAGEAISYLRRQAREAVESIYEAYVLDPDQRLIGVVSARDLLGARLHQRVEEIMVTDVVHADEGMDQAQLSRMFAAHHVSAIPVVDAAGVMKGVVAIGDIVDVVQETATADQHKLGGVEALDVPYLQATRRMMIRKRGGWLTLLMLGEMLTATAMALFQGELERKVVLALFLPLIIASGGNSGSQASTLVVRAIALGEVRPRDWWRVLRRELLAGALLGTLLAGVGLFRVISWQLAFHAYGDQWHLIAIAVTLSLFGVVVFGTLAGAMLPIVLRKLGADPAVASAPLVATLVDVTGLVIYLGLATMIVG